MEKEGKELLSVVLSEPQSKLATLHLSHQQNRSAQCPREYRDQHPHTGAVAREELFGEQFFSAFNPC